VRQGCIATFLVAAALLAAPAAHAAFPYEYGGRGLAREDRKVTAER
jgi:hypothetical protein